MSEAYIDYAQKCEVIFGAQRDIALQLPDVTDRDIQDIKYTGSGATMQAVAKAKDKIKRFRRARSSTSVPTVGTVDDLPPPYSENPPVNPFYNEYLHSVEGGNVSLNSSRRGEESPGDGRPLIGSPLHPHQYPLNQPYSPLGHPPLYPLHLDQRTPAYQVYIKIFLKQSHHVWRGKIKYVILFFTFYGIFFYSFLNSILLKSCYGIFHGWVRSLVSLL